ncbi:MAG TPA: PepSY-associated TM helix domain-containing protein [Gemmatimonadales bacterium]|nr:PepSY-associated TM helix domain-containing protein [Gemmatimonadales bacterium]
MTHRLRAAALKVHLWLGLTAGLIIAILCLTGALLVFEQEITQGLHPERYRVEGTGPFVPYAVAQDSVLAAAPGARIGIATIGTDPGRPWEFAVMGEGGPRRAFVDPHTGHVIALAPFRMAFFQRTMELHRWLLADEVGQQITGAATVMFVVLLLAGIVIWWPRTKGALRARINPLAVFNTHSGGRRKLHDLHVALGIWVWPVLLVLALTGLPEAYEWAGSTMMAVTAARRPPRPPMSGGDSTMATLPLDSLVGVARATFPGARLISVRPAGRGNGSVGIQAVAADQSSDRKTDVAYVDRHTGAVLRVDRWNDLSAGWRLRRLDETIHTGAIWGLPSKVLAFLATLLGASFPVTGLLMYRAGRKRGAQHQAS